MSGTNGDWVSGVVGYGRTGTGGMGVSGYGNGYFGIGVYGDCQSCGDQSHAGYFEGSVAVTGNLYAGLFDGVGNNTLCASAASGSAWIGHCSSSRRYKKDIVDFALGLAALESLRPVTRRRGRGVQSLLRAGCVLGWPALDGQDCLLRLGAAREVDWAP